MSRAADSLHPLILDSIAEGVFTVDSEFRLTYLNAEAERITGARREDAIGRMCYEVLRGSACQTGCPLKRSIETGEPQANVQVTMLNADMEPVPICVSTAVMTDRDGALVGGVEIFRDMSEIETLRKELSGRRSFGDIIGVSRAMQEIFSLIVDVAASDAPVLIDGASGTGKELVAKAIHEHSARGQAPFVRVNCGALPDTLLESELFGYVRGAFTDARRDKPGRFQQADGGTLFLDEVGELSPAFQVKLLRALQEGEIQPLGGTQTLVVDVRVIAATNQDLVAMTREGVFREDLYYRLCVIPIHIPPLRERQEDVIPLVEHFVAKLAASTGKRIAGLSADALRALVDYDYPGNVRELLNMLERAFALCHGELIELTCLPPAVTGPKGAQAAAGGTPGARIPLLQGRLKPSERKLFASAAARADAESPAANAEVAAGHRPEVQALVGVLNAHAWQRNATARALGISRGTLWRRMKEYGLI